jgi:hypothetical protein
MNVWLFHSNSIVSHYQCFANTYDHVARLLYGTFLKNFYSFCVSIVTRYLSGKIFTVFVMPAYARPAGARTMGEGVAAPATPARAGNRIKPEPKTSEFHR